MKNINRPTPENFILTNKKKRMIKALMRQFIIYKMVLDFGIDANGKLLFEIDDYIKFIKDRIVFLDNINVFFAIELIKGVWTGLHFQYKDEVIFEETRYRKQFFPVQTYLTIRVQFKANLQ